VLAAAASLKVTLWLLALFAASVLVFLLSGTFASGWFALPLLLLSLNLLAAIETNPAFRRHTPLLLFHLALLALLLLVAAGRLTYLKGSVEMTAGEAFPGALTQFESGPLHRSRLDRVAFTLMSFTIDYDTGRQRGATRSIVQWLDPIGKVASGRIGDHYPFVQNGYRFYTTHNKGFALRFDWQPTDGTAQQGYVHLPAYPAHEFSQAQEWTLPGTAHRLWAELQFDEVILDPEKPSQFRIPQTHTLVMRDGEIRYELKPGQSVDLVDGRITYKELRTWMGFAVFYDWTLPWLFAAGFIAVLSLGWHYWRKFAAKPWLQEG
jgi:cytochrome c biogenesis protein